MADTAGRTKIARWLLAAMVGGCLLVAANSISTPYGSRSPGAALGPVINGTATAFGGPQDLQSPNATSGGLVNGACGYGRLAEDQWPYWAVAGISPNNSLAAGSGPQAEKPAAGCGKCIEIVCADSEPNCPADAQPVTVQVVDSCPNCTATQINLSYITFVRNIAGGHVGNVSAQWQQVECHPAGPIVAVIQVYRATAGGFVSMTFGNVAGSGTFTTVDLRTSQQNGTGVIRALSEDWQQMTNSYGAVWQASALPPLPWDLRISDAKSSEQLVSMGAIRAPLQAGKQFPTTVQFSTTTSPVYTGEPGSTLQQQPEAVSTGAGIVNVSAPI